MARPLPKDLEQKIAGTAKKAELRSVAIFAFILGMIVGGALVGSFVSSTGEGNLFFFGIALVLAGYWYFSSRKKRD